MEALHCPINRAPLLTSQQSPKDCRALHLELMQELPEGAKEELQDCLETTDWNICVQDNLEDYTFTVLFYIRRCVENVN